MAKQKLERFIRSRLVGRPIVEKFQLHKCGKGDNLVLLSELDVPEGNAEQFILDSVAEFEDNASDAATAQCRALSCVVTALSEDARIIGRYEFRAEASADLVLSGSSTGSESESMQSLMPAINAFKGFAGLGLRAQEAAVEALLRENARMAQRIERMERTHLEYVEKTEELLSQQHERDLEMHRAEANEERKDRFLKLLIEEAGPALLERFTGVGPIANFLGQLKPEQIDMLKNFLPEEQQASLIAMVERIDQIRNFGKDKTAS